MLLNSFAFALFLPTVFLLYWLIPPHRFGVHNAFLLLVRYLFYDWWDWRFLSLFFLSSLLDFVVGLAIAHWPRRARWAVYYGLLAGVFWYGYTAYAPCIYFQV